MWSASSSPTGSTATKLLRGGHSRGSVSTADPKGPDRRLHAPRPATRPPDELPEQSAACARNSMKSPASYVALTAKEGACPTPTLWPPPRPWKRERRRRGRAQAPSAPKPIGDARPVKRSPSAPVAPSPCSVKSRPSPSHPSLWSRPSLGRRLQASWCARAPCFEKARARMAITCSRSPFFQIVRLTEWRCSPSRSIPSELRSCFSRRNAASEPTISRSLPFETRNSTVPSGA